MMNDIHTLGTELKSIDVYSEPTGFGNDSKRYYMKIVYEVESENDVREIIIPKVDLGIFSNRIPLLNIKTFSLSDLSDDVCSMNLANGATLPLYKTDVECVNKFGENVTIKDVEYLEVIKKETPKKMTVNEIEKKLGYKIEIVGENEDTK